MENNATGYDQARALRPLARPKTLHHMDPYERADITSNSYNDWVLDSAFVVVPAQALVAQFIGTFREYPPRQKPSSFSVDQIWKR